MSQLSSYFERIAVINLLQRRDRRREMEAQLKRVGVNAVFFAAIQSTEKGEWPSLGARGCFLSHYTVLRQALEAESRNVLVIEDDLDFSSSFIALETRLIEQMYSRVWDFLYLGHIEVLPASQTEHLELLPWTCGLQTTHFYAVNRSVLPRLVKYMEEVMARPDGHPLGGPQHVDGAFSMFRAQNPDVKTLIASPVLGSQWSSRSDITTGRLDRLPVVGGMVEVARRIRRKTLLR